MEENLIEEVKVINNENDIFGTYDKAVSICDFIKLPENEKLLEKNNLIAIYGTWGIGKSCLMKTMEERLNNENFKTMWFNTWKYEKDSNLPYSLFRFITKDKVSQKLQNIAKNVLDYGYGTIKSVVKGVELNLGVLSMNFGNAMDEMEKTDKEIQNKIKEEKSLWELIEEFEDEYKKINFSGKKLIVFLDDLDRCESENIISLISAIKLLLSINKNIMFIIGIDKGAVTLALQNKYNNDLNKADEYLEKIFPINFSIYSNINNDKFKKYISSVLEIEDIDIILKFFYAIDFTNSRHIKKILRKYVSVKDYLGSRQIDLSNKYNIILVMYFIIIHNFYNDEYRKLTIKDKEKIYNNILLINYDSKTGREVESKFDQYKVKCNLHYTNKKSYEIFNLLVRFSSYKLEKNKIDANKYISNPPEANIKYVDWMVLFENSICKRFIEFIILNTNFLDTFSNDGIYDDEKVYKIILELNNII